MDYLDLEPVRSGDRVLLTSPGVGSLSRSARRGEVLVAGQRAGVLTTLSRSVQLVVPAGVAGRIVSDESGLTRRPVEFGETVYELERVTDGPEGFEAEAEAQAQADGLVVRAEQSGRFYHRPGPGEEPFVTDGCDLESGTTLGVIEIMKTFNHVHYRPGGELPERARVVRIVAGDGADVGKGDVLVEVEAR